MHDAIKQAKQMRYQSLFHSAQQENAFFNNRHHRVIATDEAIFFIETTKQKTYIYPAFNNVQGLKDAFLKLSSEKGLHDKVEIPLHLSDDAKVTLPFLIDCFAQAACTLIDYNVAYKCTDLEAFKTIEVPIKTDCDYQVKQVYHLVNSLLGAARFDMSETDFAAYLGKDTTTLHVYHEAKEVVGFVLGYTYNNDQSVFIHGLGVLPQHRRLGIARNLMLRFLKSHALKQVNSAMLWVEKHNEAAIKLYESLGFKLTKDEEARMSYTF